MHLLHKSLLFKQFLYKNLIWRIYSNVRITEIIINIFDIQFFYEYGLFIVWIIFSPENIIITFKTSSFDEKNDKLGDKEKSSII